MGDKVHNVNLHNYIRRRIPMPDKCPKCGRKDKRFEICNIANHVNKKTYTRELKNWEWLCSTCHREKDGSTKRIQWFGKNSKSPRCEKCNIYLTKNGECWRCSKLSTT